MRALEMNRYVACVRYPPVRDPDGALQEPAFKRTFIVIAPTAEDVVTIARVSLSGGTLEKLYVVGHDYPLTEKERRTLHTQGYVQIEERVL